MRSAPVTVFRSTRSLPYSFFFSFDEGVPFAPSLTVGFPLPPVEEDAAFCGGETSAEVAPSLTVGFPPPPVEEDAAFCGGETSGEVAPSLTVGFPPPAVAVVPLPSAFY